MIRSSISLASIIDDASRPNLADLALREDQFGGDRRPVAVIGIPICLAIVVWVSLARAHRGHPSQDRRAL